MFFCFFLFLFSTTSPSFSQTPTFLYYNRVFKMQLNAQFLVQKLVLKLIKFLRLFSKMQLLKMCSSFSNPKLTLPLPFIEFSLELGHTFSTLNVRDLFWQLIKKILSSIRRRIAFCKKRITLKSILYVLSNLQNTEVHASKRTKEKVEREKEANPNISKLSPRKNPVYRKSPRPTRSAYKSRDILPRNSKPLNP